MYESVGIENEECNEIAFVMKWDQEKLLQNWPQNFHK